LFCYVRLPASKENPFKPHMKLRFKNSYFWLLKPSVSSNKYGQLKHKWLCSFQWNQKMNYINMRFWLIIKLNSSSFNNPIFLRCCLTWRLWCWLFIPAREFVFMKHRKIRCSVLSKYDSWPFRLVMRDFKITKSYKILMKGI